MLDALCAEEADASQAAEAGKGESAPAAPWGAAMAAMEAFDRWAARHEAESPCFMVSRNVGSELVRDILRALSESSDRRAARSEPADSGARAA
jgi:hypothetical protein